MWFDLVKAANGDSVNCLEQIQDALANPIATHDLTPQLYDLFVVALHPIMVGAAIALWRLVYIHFKFKATLTLCLNLVSGLLKKLRMR
jgi:hypothetical protein